MVTAFIASDEIVYILNKSKAAFTNICYSVAICIEWV